MTFRKMYDSCISITGGASYAEGMELTEEDLKSITSLEEFLLPPSILPAFVDSVIREWGIHKKKKEGFLKKLLNFFTRWNTNQPKQIQISYDNGVIGSFHRKR